MLESIYPIEWISKKTRYTFLLGLSYAVLGIFSGLFLFPKDPALVAVAITSLLLFPSLSKFISATEKKESSKKFSLTNLFKDNFSQYKFYFFSFFGVFVVFAFFSIMLPSLATSHLFEKQIALMTGNAFSLGFFENILLNNLKLMLFCFFAALLFGGGTIFLIVWNASVWGTVFGILAKTAALSTGKNPFIYFAMILVIVFPHMLLEASSYFLAAIGGGSLSRASVREKLISRKFGRVLLSAGLILLLAAFVLLAGMIVETAVVGNSEFYGSVWRAAFAR